MSWSSAIRDMQVYQSLGIDHKYKMTKKWYGWIIEEEDQPIINKTNHKPS